MAKLTYRIGGLLAGKTLTIENDMLRYQGIYGERFSVPLSLIDGVSVDTEKGFGSWAKLKIIGNGTDLASAKLPSIWAQQAQKWLMENIDFRKKSEKINPLDQLEKLADLKDKGIITQEEFDKKKTELLSL